MHYLHFKDCYALGNVELILTTPEGILGTLDEEFQLIDIGEITIGNDKDSDLIYYPGNFEATVRIPGNDGDNYDWKRIFNELSIYKFYADVYLDGAIIWSGYLDNKQSKPITDTIKRTIKFKCLDQSLSFRDFDPATNPLGYNLSNIYSTQQMLIDILTSTQFNDYPFITDVQYHGSIQARFDPGGGYQNFDFDKFGFNASFYFGSDSNYGSLLELIKQVLLNYNCIGVFGLDRIFHLYPRIYEGGTIYDIQKEDLLKNPEIELVSPVEGLQTHIWTGLYPKTDTNHFSIVDRGDVTNLNDKTKVEHIYIDQPAGTFPEAPDHTTAFSGLYVYYSGTYQLVNYDDCRYKLEDGTYAPWIALWKIPSTETWENISINRMKATVDLNGSFDKYNFNQYYRIPELSTIFKLVKAKYGIIKKRSSLIFRQAD